MTTFRFFVNLSSLVALGGGSMTCRAQLHERVSLGVVAGGVATGALDGFSRNVAESQRYTLGPIAEFRWNERFGVTAGFLYKRIGDRGGDCAFTSCGFSRTRANAWELPLLLRWRPGGREARPFVSAGYTYRRIAKGKAEYETFRTGPIVLGEEVDYSIHRYTADKPGENTHGVTAGGGIELRAGPFRVAPEARYTRWNRRFWEFYGTRGYFTSGNYNQVDVLLGVSF